MAGARFARSPYFHTIFLLPCPFFRLICFFYFFPRPFFFFCSCFFIVVGDVVDQHVRLPRRVVIVATHA